MARAKIERWGVRVPEDRTNDDLLAPSELAGFLAVSLRTLVAWGQAEYGPPPIYFTSTTVRYRWGDVLDWLDGIYDGPVGVDRAGDRLLRREEVARMVGIAPKTLERWLSGALAGIEGPAVVRISASTIRYWESDVRAWVRSYAGRRQAETAEFGKRVGP